MFFLFLLDNNLGENMKVKIFDFEHEKDLEDAVNDFLLDKEIEIKQIDYRVSHFFAINEQLYSFSVLILYEKAPIKL